MVRIVVTSHATMAEGLVRSVEMLAGKQPHVVPVCFEEESGIEALEEHFEELFANVSKQEQYLVFCDILGGTPFNVASRFSYHNDNIAVIYGMNLPLVIEAALMTVDEAVDLQDVLEELLPKLSESIGLSTL